MLREKKGLRLQDKEEAVENHCIKLYTYMPDVL